MVSPARDSFSFDPPVQSPKSFRREAQAQHRSTAVLCGEGGTARLATPVTVGTASDPKPHGNFGIYSKIANQRRQSNPGAGHPITY